MGLTSNSLANAVGVGAKNVAFKPSASVLARKIGVVGSYDPALTSVIPDVPVLVTSPEDAGAKFGFGFMLHRLCLGVFKGSKGQVPVYCVPRAEGNSAVQAEGTVTFTGPASASGVYSLYIGGDKVSINVAKSATATDVAGLLAAAINANPLLPVTATSALGVTTITVKSGGTWGNSVYLADLLDSADAIPAGITAVIVDIDGGADTPATMAATLAAAFGTGDSANSLGITDLTHGYGATSQDITDIAEYVGLGDDFTGLYDKLCARPFRCLIGRDSSLTSTQSFVSTRTLDRANGFLMVPEVNNHQAELGAQGLGIIARINNVIAEGSYEGQPLEGVIWRTPAQNIWTKDYTARDAAVKSGLSPTKYDGSALVLTNVVTFYRPDSIPVESNGYRSMRNISITQNILAATKATFSAESWRGISIVADVKKVKAAASRQKARDIAAVLDALVGLIGDFEGNAWIYAAAPALAALKTAGSVTLRQGGTGFDSVLKLYYSGEGGILNTDVLFDINIAAITA